MPTCVKNVTLLFRHPEHDVILPDRIFDFSNTPLRLWVHKSQFLDRNTRWFYDLGKAHDHWDIQKVPSFQECVYVVSFA